MRMKDAVVNLTVAVFAIHTGLKNASFQAAPRLRRAGASVASMVAGDVANLRVALNIMWEGVSASLMAVVSGVVGMAA